jgi:hypothetical protein
MPLAHYNFHLSKYAIPVAFLEGWDLAFFKESWELMWHFSKDENFSGISRIHNNFSGILINKLMYKKEVMEVG